MKNNKFRRKLIFILSLVLMIIMLSDCKKEESRNNASDHVTVPILLYHHFSHNSKGISYDLFESHLKILSKEGYNTVTFDQLLAYVKDGTPLPERPVCITMDDGYLSNYEIAWPLLKKYKMKATIFIIGVSVGHTQYYKDTNFYLTPHFTWEQGREMVASGVIDLQCHTYDMHQWETFEKVQPIRKNILPLEGETELQYTKYVKADLLQFQKEYLAEIGKKPYVLAYPGGEHNELSEKVVHDLGFSITVTSNPNRKNIVMQGMPKSLHALGRYDITEKISPQELLAIVRALS